MSNGATAVWSGYNHQGRVGLFVALNELNRVKEEASTQNHDELVSALSNWRIQFEMGEDFEIVDKREDDVFSRHQVKAYNSTQKSRYDTVFQKREKKNSKGRAVTDANGDPVLIDGFKCEGVSDERCYLHVIQDINIAGWDTNDYKIRLYQYPVLAMGSTGKTYCGFSKATSEEDEIMGFAVAEIIKLTGKNDSACKIIWKDLQHILQAKLSVAHHEANVATFGFEEILDVCTSGSALTDYDSDGIRRQIDEYYQEYLFAKESNPSFDESMRIRLASYVQSLLSLEPKMLIKTIRYMHLDESGTHSVISNKVGLKQVVYEVLSRVENFDYDPACMKHEEEGRYYVLTTITELEANEDEDKKGTNRAKAQKILQSLEDEDVALTFTDSNVINKNLTAPFSYLIGNDVLTNEFAGNKVFDITKAGLLEFVSVEYAVSKLNSKDT